MIRVLHVVVSLDLGGTEAFIMNVYRNIDRSKVQFDFLVLKKGNYPYIDEIEKLGGKVFFGTYPRYKNILEFFKTAVPVMADGNYDVVHSHLNNINGWVMLAAKKAKIPKRVSHSHDTFGLGGSTVIKLIHRYEKHLVKSCANVYLACSNEAGEYLYGKEFFHQKGRVVRNGIDVEKWIVADSQREKELRRELEIENGKLIIGNISRFEPKKNQLFLIDVFIELHRIKENAVLVLGGVDAGQLNSCKEKAVEAGIEKKVIFLGPRKDMPDLLHLFDFFVFPSLYEGLGIILLEAQAAGCKCIASTNCPTDSDMGLGLIEYYSLDESPKEWAEHIVEKSSACKSFNQCEIFDAFSQRGYTVKALSDTMASIYCS